MQEEINADLSHEFPIYLSVFIPINICVNPRLKYFEIGSGVVVRPPLLNNAESIPANHKSRGDISICSAIKWMVRGSGV
jgi:hypothetical protein